MAKHDWKSSFGDSQIAGMYDLGETLGRGHYAVVKVARHVITGERVAVKVIDKTKLDEVSREHLLKEVRCMKLVQHPNVVRLYQVIDTNTKLYLILELGDGGDMYDYIMNHEKGLGEEKARYFFRQIVLAIDYCHKLHVVHRDLKPENVIFFKNQDMAKLTDFGFSNNFIPNEKLETACGSLAYSAPEVLLGDAYEAPAVDVWSLGVILYMLVCGQAPFSEANDSETLTKIMDCRYQVPDHVSRSCKNLISRMLIREPHHRACLEEIMNHTWLQQGMDPLIPSDIPLVTELPLTAEEHLLLLEKMESGNIAERDKVIRSLEENLYDSYAATYFLLAEQHLRRLSESNSLSNPEVVKKRRARGSLPDSAFLTHRKPSSRPSSAESDSGSERSGDSSPRTSSPRLSRRLAPREGQILNRTIQAHAIEVDEVLHSSMEEDERVPNPLMDARRISNSLDTIPSNAAAQPTGNLYPAKDDVMRQKLLSTGVRPRNRRNKSGHLPLTKAKSTPMHLNEIYEERESDLEESPRSSPRLERPRRHVGGGAIKAKRNTRRLSPVPSTGSRRSSSCSSSDDDDLDKHMKRLDTSSSCRRSPRHRRSDDSGSEGDGGFGAGGGGGGGMGLRSMNTSNTSVRTGNESSSKGGTSKNQNGGGKTNSMNKGNYNYGVENKFALGAIDESNKENVCENLSDEESYTKNSDFIFEEQLFHSEKTPLIGDCKEAPVKTKIPAKLGSEPARPYSAPPVPKINEPSDCGRNYSVCSERKGSAVKYIHKFSVIERTFSPEEEPLTSGGSKRDSLTPRDFENIDMKVQMKRARTLPPSSATQLRILNPALQTVTSNCCQIV